MIPNSPNEICRYTKMWTIPDNGFSIIVKTVKTSNNLEKPPIYILYQ